MIVGCYSAGNIDIFGTFTVSKALRGIKLRFCDFSSLVARYISKILSLGLVL